MRILVITRNAWDDRNSIGNTVSNFFKDIPGIEFANIYFRSSLPNNHLCQRYYQVTEKCVLQNWFTPSKIGKVFSYEAVHTDGGLGDLSQTRERKLIAFLHKHNICILNRISDSIWNSKKWINQNLRSFVNDFAPDLVFSFVKSAPQYYLTIRFLREEYSVPLLTWIADDEYTGYLHNGKTELIEKLRYILQESSEVRGCSEEICDYYNIVFGCASSVLYKACDLSVPIKETINDPISIVYAGNLLYGRLDIIRLISDELERYSNTGGKDVLFEIYSNTPLSDSAVMEHFGQNSHTAFRGMVSYKAIKERLLESDVVVHVESFEDNEILKTRYSFSTKIIDYLQCGSVILAVGPDCVSSMKYIKKIPGACVIDDVSSVKHLLPALLNDSINFSERIYRIREFALNHHDARVLSEELDKTLRRVAFGSQK